jgi:hypothetical protein
MKVDQLNGRALLLGNGRELTLGNGRPASSTRLQTGALDLIKVSVCTCPTLCR